MGGCEGLDRISHSSGLILLGRSLWVLMYCLLVLAQNVPSFQSCYHLALLNCSVLYLCHTTYLQNHKKNRKCIYLCNYSVMSWEDKQRVQYFL